METLELLVNKICDYNEENDTIDNYIKVMRCCCECFKLANWEYLETGEIENINKGIEIWKSNEYNPMLLERLYFSTAKKIPPNNKNILRRKTLKIGSNLLISYEHWKDIHHRPYMLDYFTSDLVDIGIHESKILMKIINYYPEFIE